jgi:hypothetical protein
MNPTMHKIIMRRVYYSYLLSIVFHPMFWRGMFLAIAGLLLADWLHMASITHNFLAVPVGNAPQFVMQAFVNAISHGELLTALTLTLAGGVALSAGYQLSQALASFFSTPKTA